MIGVPSMNDQLRAFFDEQAKAVDADVHQAIELCNGRFARPCPFRKSYPDVLMV
jgi:hypothetical protein